jgi:hypothetical protein
VLEAHEREKKTNFLEACLEQRWHFSPFMASTDGLLGKESQTLLKKLSALLAEKWEKPYSEMCGYVNARMSIALWYEPLVSVYGAPFGAPVSQRAK